MSYRESYDDRRDDRRGGDRDRYDDRRGGYGGDDRGGRGGGGYGERRGGGDRYGDDRRGGGGRGGYEDRRGGYGGDDRGGRGGGRSSRVRLYVGRLTANTREAEIEDLFSRYGPLKRVDMKTGFCFVEYTDELDAKDACEKLDGYKVDGERLAVEFAKDKPRFGDRDGGPGGRDGDKPACCYNCGKFDHWARDCPDPPGQGARSQRYGEGKCFSCGQQGHRARDCPSGPGGGGGGGGYESRGRPAETRRSASPRRASSGSPRKRSPSPRGGGGGAAGGDDAPAPAADDGMAWNV